MYCPVMPNGTLVNGEVTIFRVHTAAAALLTIVLENLCSRDDTVTVEEPDPTAATWIPCIHGSRRIALD